MKHTFAFSFFIFFCFGNIFCQKDTDLDSLCSSYLKSMHTQIKRNGNKYGIDQRKSLIKNVGDIPFSVPAARVDYDAYIRLALEAREHRQKRLLLFDDFIKMAQDTGVVVLDARSAEMYTAKHLKGAVNLNFSDFTEENLSKVIPHKSTRVLIYCNNNFDGDPYYFADKSLETSGKYTLTLALNVPTYINLYGYGYRNVYELEEMKPAYSPQIPFEGTSVEK